jgi:hypothetical protein
MRYADDPDNSSLVLYGVYHTVITNAYAICSLTFKLDRSSRTGSIR